MRHKIKHRKLNRTSSHRKALLQNLAKSLILHERIKTTLPKAKELRPFLEKIITDTKIDNVANRRKLYKVFQDNSIINKLFTDIGKRVEKREGGYLRILKFGFRTGDKAPMAIIEFVDKMIQKNNSKK